MILLTILLLNIPPVVSITSHTNNQIVSPGAITIKANASDADGKITKVAFFLNSSTKAFATEYGSPYVASLTLTSGSYTIKARAYDNSGSYRTASVILKVVSVEDRIAAVEKRISELEKKDSTDRAHPDTTIFDISKFDVIHETPHRTRIKIK